MCICNFLGPKGTECLVSLGRLCVECYFATWEPSSELNAALSCSPMHVGSTCMKGFKMNDTHLQLIKLTEPVLSLLPKSIYELRVPFRSPVEGAWCRSAVSQHWTHRVKERQFLSLLTHRENVRLGFKRCSQDWSCQRQSYRHMTPSNSGHLYHALPQ